MRLSRHLIRSAAAAVIGAFALFAPRAWADWQVGLNLPATRGSSNAGNFQPGVFPFDYALEIRQRIENGRFTSLRLSVNVETAHNEQALDQLEALSKLVGHRGILCMWDTNLPGEHGHGNGLPNDLDALAAAWKAVHAKFSAYPDLRYEIFNEPFGYRRDSAGAARYLADMRYVIKQAGLPEKRCILDGLGYADNVRLVAEAGWTGALAYHIYPNWLPEARRSRSAYASVVESALAGLSNEIVFTEFGSRLDQEDYESDSGRGDAGFLLGVREGIVGAIGQGVNVTGTYHWHGWDNGDTYSHWGETNARGREILAKVQAPVKPGAGTDSR